MYSCLCFPERGTHRPPSPLFPRFRKPRRDLGELRQGCFQVVGDFVSQNVGRRQRISIGQALIFDLEEIQAELIPLEQLLVIVGAPPLAILAALCKFTSKKALPDLEPTGRVT